MVDRAFGPMVFPRFVARKLRVEYPGAMYHVMNRGDHQEVIFRGSRDRELFLHTLAQACEKTDWQVHAWCLMSNHFHLVVETPRGKLRRSSSPRQRILDDPHPS